MTQLTFLLRVGPVANNFVNENLLVLKSFHINFFTTNCYLLLLGSGLIERIAKKHIALEDPFVQTDICMQCVFSYLDSPLLRSNPSFYVSLHASILHRSLSAN